MSAHHLGVIRPVCVVLLALLLSGADSVSARADALITLHPHQGPPGTAVKVKGSGWGGMACYPLHPAVAVSLIDSDGAVFGLGSTQPRSSGNFRITVTIPAGPSRGWGSIEASRIVGRYPRCFLVTAQDPFKVTRAMRPEGN